METKPVRTYRILCILILISITMFLVISMILIKPVRIVSSSMTPALMDGDMALALRSFRLKPGYIYGYSFQDMILVKRLIGMPGSIIECRNGTLYIDFEQYQPDHDYQKQHESWLPLLCPDDELFMIGDNRPASTDSRQHGTVKINHIQYRVFMVLFPLNRSGLVR
jgi:signal peptidase I